MLYIANLLYLIALLCVSPLVLYRAIRYGRYKRGAASKLFGITRLGDSPRPTIWIHAVSVGEVQLVRPLVQRFAQEFPSFRIAISTSTDSGYDIACELYKNHDVFFAPLDFSWAVSRVFRDLHPKLLVLAELEIWPNWLRQAESSGCPVAIVNGRLSESSFRGYKKLSFIVRRALSSVTWIGVQNETYQERFIALGAAPNRVVNTGSIKFDNASSSRSSNEILDRRQLLQIDSTDLIWVVGSTQYPEEQLMIDAFMQLRSKVPNLRMILVPRHKERFEDVAKKIQSTGIPWDRRSRLDDANPINQDWQIFLGDSIGELRWWWGMADIGFVGGSFGDRGGQNMIEPCAYGVATSFGPNTKNFRDVVRLLRDKNACKQFENPSEIVPWVLDMAHHPELRIDMGKRAAGVASEHRGATERTWVELRKLLAQDSKLLANEKDKTHPTN
ncbi:MAG: 3-deoxy-D-manno-octulosonic acid transferase [Pirellula sp.]|jgi:3-deoxy-D-manno-octulosonic-acid transferase|nr:3-deoxy-D-manno-octulosonic acid transferase [Pirellula sp.]